uniref:Glycosyltransferase 2-like domain-containing protein n=1 Tax=viral metagenome TaxID=1070528 RepID=A0A6C0DTN1_9ZZZZ
MRVVIFSWGAGNQQYGLGHDAKTLDRVIRDLDPSALVSHRDPHAFVGRDKPTVADIHIYLEVPCRVAFAWARVNIVIPNAEWWYTAAWSWVRAAGAKFWFRTRHCERCFAAIGIKGTYIGWPNLGMSDNREIKKDRALYVVGGSKHKLAAAKRIVRVWKAEWPPLTLLSATEAPIEMAPNVEWRREYLTESAKNALMASSRYHVVASEAEGLGYTMLEALYHNALILRTDLPVYEELWSGLLGDAGSIKTSPCDEPTELLDPRRTFTDDAVVVAMNSLLVSRGRVPSVTKETLMRLTKSFRKNIGVAWSGAVSTAGVGTLYVPRGPPTDYPVMGVITLVHNRPQWFSHAVRNIETSSWPRDKLVWVIVDDGDSRVDAQVERAVAGLHDLQIRYVSLPKKVSIGEKRNRGCVAAAATRPDVSVFAFMDDDDHYPSVSLAMRWSWLLASGGDCVYASTLPMYDITRYISAMNVPPLTLAPCERVSEATLCFKRSFWTERRFPDVSVAEGEEFLKGREDTTAEIPPDGVIVSFLHGRNFTSRRVPEDKDPNGCHYGFSDEYFTMISQLAGLVV